MASGGDHEHRAGPEASSSPSLAEGTARLVLPGPRAPPWQRGPEDTSLRFDGPLCRWTWESGRKIGLHCGGAAALVRPPPPQGGRGFPGTPPSLVLCSPLTLEAQLEVRAGREGFWRRRGTSGARVRLGPGASPGTRELRGAGRRHCSNRRPLLKIKPRPVVIATATTAAARGW